MHKSSRTSCPVSLSSRASAPASVQSVRHRRPVSSVHAVDKHAVVLGGGVGGLVAACKLAKAGLKVTLLEQHSKVGGRCQSEVIQTEHGDFRFDTGPSLLLYPHVYKKTFASLGVDMESLVPIKRVDPAAYRVWFDNNTHLDLLYDIPSMLNQLEKVEPGAGQHFLTWLGQARTALEVGTREFIERDFDGLFDFLDLRRLLPLLGQVDVLELLGKHHDRLAKRFKDPRLRALFTFQDLYVGLSPYTAPGAFSLLAATELTDGVYYPVGGFGQVKDALLNIAEELGVVVRTNARVSSINTFTPRSPTLQKTYVSGVNLDSGEVVRADLVVSNRDVPLTYQILDHQEAYGYKQFMDIRDKQYSASVIAYNFCVKGKLDNLAHHNVFMSGDYEGSWRRATSADTLLPRPNFYVHCPSHTDPTAAPPGCESVMVLLPVANIQEVFDAQKSDACPVTDSSDREPGLAAPSYDDMVAAGRQVIAKAFRKDGISKDFLSQVVHEFVIDPVEWQSRYGIMHGAVFGLSHGLDQLALFRPGVKDTQVKGLYMVGASARPGNGVPLVMISAELAVNRVLKDLKIAA